MADSLHFLIDEGSKTAEARRLARHLAADLGFQETQSEQVGIVVTEACTNLLKHAGQGELIVHAALDGFSVEPVLEVIALDRGPGMSNMADCLRDGYSTGGSPGQGLGAIVRLSNYSDFYTVPKKGTAILARWSAGTPKELTDDRSPLRVGAVNVPKSGETVSGDSWACIQSRDRMLLIVADGLGHGLDANLASAEAIRMLRLHPGYEPRALLESCHQAMRPTRGAAVAVAQIDRSKGVLTFTGVGNIAARIYAGSVVCQSLVSVNGTAGQKTERMQEFTYPWPSNGLLEMHSDGLTSATGLENYPGLALRDPALIAGVLYRDFSRGRDDSTVVVVKVA